jgi:hypothetical protein
VQHLPVFRQLTILYNVHGTSVLVPAPDERRNHMKEKYITEITQLLESLDENKLLYILTFIKKLFF